MTSLSTSSPSFSPSRSPGRRLSARRGSVSASDPWGTHSEVNYNPERNTSSRLTIVRVSPTPVKLEEPPRPGSPHQRRLSRRHGSNASLGSAKSEGNRLSFASASFGGPNGSRPGSPATSRNHSPVRNHSRSASIPNPRLSPEELIEVARSSSRPSYMPSPRSSPISPYPSHSPEKFVQPAQFTPLPDDVYLPFLERPSEVSTLLSTYPTAKLWALLQQMFPADKRGTPDESGPAGPVDVSGDPAHWHFAQLAYWLKHVDRDDAPDEVWVKAARRCVASHSELIWERLKGALGVPADLDVESDEDEDETELEEAYTDLDVSPAAQLPSPIERRIVDDAAEIAQIEGMDPEKSPEITIEPIVVPTTPPLNSQDPSGPLQEIQEDQEDEAETGDEKQVPESPKELCQGLRIVNSPSSPHAIGPVARSPFSFALMSPSPSLSPGSAVVFSPKNYGRRASVGSHYSTGSADVPFDVLRERGPGHPLFPSSFANLALGPTLTANNRALRRPSALPPPAYANPHAIRGRRDLPSWADGYDLAKHEHAITIGSASSVDE
ncbi:hypothetical protein NEOLEDRAFT_376718 [Neolentinus lepideus HHB14362 ss-1]|uniref:Uncharacterized protein n=1 Tax=Neolentinus lepideus HHB14362 ss-1 TaxID=1314782 RepID=A0A165SJM4_9AGAM|nr:hypothetical protein NEOLEDRAFT_376718 [Neolentinus lepideus HHB14362 ss-1]